MFESFDDGAVGVVVERRQHQFDRRYAGYVDKAFILCQACHTDGARHSMLWGNVFLEKFGVLWFFACRLPTFCALLPGTCCE